MKARAFRFKFTEFFTPRQARCPGINARRRKAGKEMIPRKTLSLHSAEDYADPADAPRIATIYNGLCQFARNAFGGGFSVGIIGEGLHPAFVSRRIGEPVISKFSKRSVDFYLADTVSDGDGNLTGGQEFGRWVVQIICLCPISQGKMVRGAGFEPATPCV
jgi:hypothetical protein